MADTEDLSAKVKALEAHVAHQQSALDDMSEQIAKQWDQIDRLTKTAQKLHEQTSDHANQLGAAEQPGDVKPPHY